MWLGAFGPDIGNLTLMTWCRDREMFLDLLQELGGSRMHYNYPRLEVSRETPNWLGKQNEGKGQTIRKQNQRIRNAS